MFCIHIRKNIQMMSKTKVSLGQVNIEYKWGRDQAKLLLQIFSFFYASW